MSICWIGSRQCYNNIKDYSIKHGSSVIRFGLDIKRAEKNGKGIQGACNRKKRKKQKALRSTLRMIHLIFKIVARSYKEILVML